MAAKHVVINHAFITVTRIGRKLAVNFSGPRFREILDEFKETVSPDWRKWDSEGKHWTVSFRAVYELTRVLKRFGVELAEEFAALQETERRRRLGLPALRKPGRPKISRPAVKTIRAISPQDRPEPKERASIYCRPVNSSHPYVTAMERSIFYEGHFYEVTDQEFERFEQFLEDAAYWVGEKFSDSLPVMDLLIYHFLKANEHEPPVAQTLRTGGAAQVPAAARAWATGRAHKYAAQTPAALAMAS